MNILLAIDDSKYSEAATEAIMARMWPSDAYFKVVSVLDEAESSKAHQSEQAASAPSPHSPQAIRNAVSATANRLREKFPTAPVLEEILYGHPKEALLDYASTWPADLIAVGTHGRRGLTRILLGSVSQTLLLYGQCSTLIVRLSGGENAPVTAGKGLERILIPVDPSEHSKRALDWLLHFPWDHQAQFKILSVIPPMDGLSLLQEDQYSADRLKARAAAQTLIDESKSKLAAAFGPDRITAEIAEGDPADIIIKAAQRWPADLVLMGTRGHGTAKRLWLGSIAQEVVLHASCPVEVVKRLSVRV